MDLHHAQTTDKVMNRNHLKSSRDTCFLSLLNREVLEFTLAHGFALSFIFFLITLAFHIEGVYYRNWIRARTFYVAIHR